MKVDKKKIKKWVKALRSGKYKQTKYKLQDHRGFCCLGVACDIFIPKEKKRFLEKNRCLYGDLPKYQKHSPAWLLSINDDFDTKTNKRLSVLNDNDRMSFDEIADLLEAVYIHEVLK